MASEQSNIQPVLLPQQIGDLSQRKVLSYDEEQDLTDAINKLHAGDPIVTRLTNVQRARSLVLNIPTPIEISLCKTPTCHNCHQGLGCKIHVKSVETNKSDNLFVELARKNNKRRYKESSTSLNSPICGREKIDSDEEANKVQKKQTDTCVTNKR